MLAGAGMLRAETDAMRASRHSIVGTWFIKATVPGQPVPIGAIYSFDRDGSLLTDRAAFDPVLPQLSRRFRVTVPNLPGFHGSKPVEGGLAAYIGWGACRERVTCEPSFKQRLKLVARAADA